jgi:L-fuculose-phosphate aldolase
MTMTPETELRQQICDIGQRAWSKGFVAACDGNISARLDANRILCTPTMICKGFMNPDDLCVVDLDGNHLEGDRKPTSEIKLHLAIYRQRADIRSVFHSHSPHATAFAITGQTIPSHVLAEPEIFLGDVPLTEYATPGSLEFAASIDPYVANTNAILLANHGVVTYHTSVQTAFWLTEILDSCCRILINAQSIGNVRTISAEQASELAALRAKLGYAP